VFVTRWWGGILLGPVRFRYFEDLTRMAIEAALREGLWERVTDGPDGTSSQLLPDGATATAMLPALSSGSTPGRLSTPVPSLGLAAVKPSLPRRTLLKPTSDPSNSPNGDQSGPSTLGDAKHGVETEPTYIVID
jgi:hypothetical protein